LISAAALPQAPLGELPRPRSWILRGPKSKGREGRRIGKKQRNRKKGKRRGQGGQRRKGERQGD